MYDMNFGSRILEGIISPDLQRALLPLRVIFIIVALVILVLIVWLFRKSSYKNYFILDWWRDYNLLKSIRAGELDDSPEEGGQVQPQKRQEPEKTGEEEKEAVRTEMSDWERIIGKLKAKNELKCKLALLDANRLFDKEIEERGKDLKKLSNFEKIGKIKNYLERLLEKPSKGITFRNANNMIAEYKKALEEIGAL